jgi:alkylhydroperoxidase family enzyme
MSYLAQTKTMDNLMEALLRDHARYLPVVEFLDRIVQNASQLSWADCELIGLELGRQNRSGFCAGIRMGMIKALADVDGADGDRADPDSLAPIIAFARQLNERSGSVTEADIDAVRAAGWTDQTVEDVVGLVAALKVYSIIANGLGFEALPEAAFAEMGEATVAMNGYTPLFRSFMSKG